MWHKNKSHNSHKYCSSSCSSLGKSLNARNNPGLGTKRSKQEIELFEMCKNYFPDTIHNEKIFNGWDADIIIPSFKIAILWNGPWHYKEMGLKNHSLKQVQNRDNIKIKEIEKLGFTPLIYEDRYFTPSTAFEHLKNLISK